MNSNRKTCAEIALDLKTYYAGQNQATHPNVIAFDEAWHGYRYYMAYTAYPYANGSEENPCLAASNDLIHWEKPAGLINPIACCEETQCDELKDTHLLYRRDLDRLEMWYLGRIDSDTHQRGPLYCFRKVSSDGIRWSEYQIMYKFSELSLASPSILWDERGYHFWGIHNSQKDTGAYYMHSTDGTDWTSLQPCTIPQSMQTHMWHGTVSLCGDTYCFVWVGNVGETFNRIYYSTSSDGLTFTTPQVLLTNDTGWAHLYRPALLYENGVYYCFYGVIRLDNKWLIAMSRGFNLDSMIGLNSQEIGFSPERISSSAKLRIKHAISQTTRLIVPRLFLLIPVILLGQFLIDSLFLTLILSVLLCSIAYTRFNRNQFIQGGVLMGLLCAIVSNYVYCIALSCVQLFIQ